MKHTYEECYQCAKQCKTRTEFKKKGKYLYSLSHNKGWINDFIWLTSNRKHFENLQQHCFDVAKQFEYKKDFKEQYFYEFLVSSEKGWINDYNWLKLKINYWTPEICEENAKKCKTLSEFSKLYNGCYIYALKHNLLEKYTWLERKESIDYYWNNEERCLKAARQCSSRMQFKKDYGTAYYYSIKNKWIDSYNWFKISYDYDLEKREHIVYAYEDKINKVCYIGRTKNLKSRNHSHKVNKKDSVKIYFDSIENDVPDPITLKKDLTAIESRKYEGLYVESYKNNNWTLLNKAKTGENSSSLGGSYRIWSKEHCLEVANSCNSLYQFRHEYPYVYGKFLNNEDWQKELNLFNDYKKLEQKPRFYWTYERCYIEAKQYNSISEFRKNGKGAVKAAIKNKWINEYTWLY